MKKFYLRIVIFVLFVTALFSAVSFLSLANFDTNISAEININLNNTIQNDIGLDVENEVPLSTTINNASFYTNSKLTNNLVLVKFKNETVDYTLYKNSYTTFNTMFNTGEISVKEYYKINSNGKLNLTTDIITTNNTDALIVTLDKERTYYMPYVILDETNGATKYTYNSNGYFDYYLIKKNSTYSSKYPQFYKDNQLIAKVYKIPDGSSLPIDSNYSDKIMTYNEAASLAASTSGYELVQSNERYLREYQLLCNALEDVKNYISTSNSDVNNDGIFDCLSIGLIDNERVSKYHMDASPYWSSLLWPHKVENLGLAISQSYSYVKSLGEAKCVDYYANFGFNKTDIQTIFDYMENQPKAGGLTFNTIDMASYEVYDIAIQSKWNAFVKNITTISHELGHVLGLPDLYIYPNNDSNAVGSWSHMCNSHTTYPSFFTSYERGKLGWLDSTNNIKDITTKGLYTLNAVKGFDGSNVVAYRIADPNNPYQYVYIEYRNLALNYYDTKCGTYPGLIAYTVNTDLENGNKDAPPYEIYINRKSGDNVYSAAIDVGETLGNSITSSKTNAILFNIGTGSEKNSGIVIEVVERTEDELIFKVTSQNLGEAVPYTVNDFNGNTSLYSKLLAQTSTKKLTYDSLKSKTALDLSYTDIDNLTFLSLFEFNSLKYLNIIGNNFTETFDFNKYKTKYSLKNIFVAFNNVNLKALEQSCLTDLVYDWGVQYITDAEMYVNEPCNFMYYYTTSSNITSITINGTTYLNACNQGVVSDYSLSTNGENKVNISFKTNGMGLSSIIEIITVVQISSFYPSSENCYYMGKGDSFPVIAALVGIFGCASNRFTFNYTYPATNISKTGYFNVSILYDGVQIENVKVYYSIVSINVIFNNDNPVILEVGEEYTEKGITVYENNINKNYTQATTGPCTYSIKYYSGTISNDGTVNLGSQKPIDSSTNGSYLVCYTIRTSFEKVYKYYLPVLIDDNLIKLSRMNADLYQVLLDISGKEYVYKSDFSGLDYLDLSNKNLTSVQGLELLNLKQNSVVDLTNNKLNTILELKNVVANNNQIKGIIALFNYFNSSDINGLVNRTKYCFAIQNISTTNIDTSLNNAVADFYNDYSSYFILNCSNYKQQNSKLYFTVAGSNVCSFYSSSYSKNYSKTIHNIVITSKTQTVKEYSEPISFVVTNFFDVSGIAVNSLTISSNFTSLQFNKVGEKLLTVIFGYNSKSLELTHSVLVRDTDAPVITLGGSEEVYITSLDQYERLYQNNICTATDAYNGRVDVDIVEPVINGCGVYNVEYQAKDSSDNKALLIRKVYWGNVELVQDFAEVEYNIGFSIPFNYEVFNRQQFDIKYKLDYESDFVNYINSILVTKFGETIIDIKLVHKQNSEIQYSFVYKVLVNDKEAPHIELNGDLRLTIYAGAKYEEIGYSITDNGTKDILTNNNSSNDIRVEISYMFKAIEETNFLEIQDFDTEKIGEYLIKYTAIDSSLNESYAERFVEIVYAPIEQIEIDQSRVLSRYSAGQVITLNVNSISEYITEPNPTIVWFVNDRIYKQVEGTSLDISFDDAGDYVIYAKVLGSDKAFSQNLSISIYKPSPFEGIAIYIVIAVSVAVVAIIIGTIISRYRKRNFY